MLGVLLATQEELVASVVAAESWRSATGRPVVVLVDHPDLVGPFTAAHEGTEVLSWAQLGTPSGATGALVAATLARQEPGTIGVLVPAGSLVLAPPAALEEAAARGVAVAARGTRPVEADDRLRPTADEVAALGPRHLGLLGLRAGDPDAEAVLAWLDDTAPDARVALLGSQDHRLVDVDDPGLGVAWWNLHERPLRWEGDRLLAADSEVSVVDLSGWAPLHEHMLHPDMTRLLGSGDPALRRLVDDYARRSAEVAARVGAGRPRVWPDDPALADLLDRRDADDRERALRDDPGARDSFLAWAGETDREDTVWGLNRYLVALRRTRYDLQAAFPDVNDRGDVVAYLEWARADGGGAIPERFLGHVVLAEGEPPTEEPLAAEEQIEGEPGGDGPGAAAAPEPEPEPVAPDAGLHGVNVIGLFDEPALGVAEVARQVLHGLEQAGLAVHRVTVDRRGRPSPEDGDEEFPHRVTIACVNGDLLPVVRHRLRRRVQPYGHNIGVWWWELSEVPADWDPAIALVHEIWAGTTFVADAFRGRFDGPVRTVPLGLAAPAEATTLPAAVAADPRPYVLVTFDYASRVERKNPVGAIEAFVRADLGPDVRLVVKSVNGDLWPREAERVRLAALRAPRGSVLLLDAQCPSGEQAALVAGAAAHLALHRSEGLGLTIVEAMLRGVPVVATDYGGSTDLLDHTTGWPVAFAAGAVPDGCDPYPAGATWAEPDVDDAARALREVVAGGPQVEARVAAALRSAEARAARIASGEDLGRAALDAIDVLRAAIPPPPPPPPGVATRVWRRLRA